MKSKVSKRILPMFLLSYRDLKDDFPKNLSSEWTYDVAHCRSFCPSFSIIQCKFHQTVDFALMCSQSLSLCLEAATATAKLLQLCLTLCDPIDGSPPGSPITGVGCHFLLQYMKVKSEREVAQSCPTLSDPMDYSLPGFSIHGIFQARVLFNSQFFHFCVAEQVAYYFICK